MQIQSQIYLGWTPILAVATDGDRRVLQVVGWDGGSGTIPIIGVYLGVSGFVSNISDGINVRGAIGPAGSVSTSNDETPSGIMDGVNNVFTLAHTPLNNTLKAYLNGIRLRITKDYTISGAILIMINTPQNGDELLVDYNY